MAEESRLNRMLETMQGFDEEEAGSFIEDIMAQIKEPPKRVPENVFREIFLPVFAGLDPDLEKKTHEFTAHWAGIVGSQMESAQVVNMQGETLFTVPPICDTSRLVDTKGVVGKDSYKNIFGNLVDSVTVNPQAAIGEFTMAASKRLNAALKHDEIPPSENPWMPVFAFYGLVQGEAGVPQPASQETGKKIDEDFEF